MISDKSKILFRESLSLFDVINGFKTVDIDSRNKIFGSKNYSQEEILNSWKNSFTDPVKHNEKDFCYLVHGLQNNIGRIKQYKFIMDRNGWDETQYFDLLTDPQKIVDKKMVSASVVSDEHLFTYGEVGLILFFDFDNIRRAAPRDFGADISNPETVFEMEKHILPVDELLKLSAEFGEHNEVILTQKKSKIFVNGFWHSVFEDGESVDLKNCERIKLLGEKYKLPVLPIKKNYGFFKKKIEKMLNSIENGKDFGFGVSQNGKHFLIDFDGLKANVVDENLQSKDLDEIEFKKLKKRFKQKLENLFDLINCV